MSAVYTSKKCIVVAPEAFGQTGFRQAASGELEPVVFDEGGLERQSREEGGGFVTKTPGWVSFEEFDRRKEARSRAWKKSHEGQKDFLDRRHLYEKLSESRVGFGYGDELPFAVT